MEGSGPFFVVLFAVIAAITLVMLKKSPVMTTVVLALPLAFNGLEWLKNWRAVAAIQHTAHALVASDPRTLVLLDERDRLEVATLMYGAGLDVVYSLDRYKPIRYIFDYPDGTSYAGVRYVRTGLAGCEKFSFDRLTTNRKHYDDPDLDRCMQSARGSFDAAEMGARAIVYANHGMTRTAAVHALAGYELRGRTEGADQLVAYDESLDLDYDWVKFLRRGLSRH